MRGMREHIPGTAAPAAKYPGDFDLFLLGVYDVESGVIVTDVRLVENLSVILAPELRREGAERDEL